MSIFPASGCWVGCCAGGYLRPAAPGFVRVAADFAGASARGPKGFNLFWHILVILQFILIHRPRLPVLVQAVSETFFHRLRAIKPFQLSASLPVLPAPARSLFM